MDISYSFVHRLEAKLDDLIPPEPESEVKAKSKPISIIEMESGSQPSFMRPTTRYLGYF